jgi:two-component system, NarL family, sensor histidine kinase UhpB
MAADLPRDPRVMNAVTAHEAVRKWGMALLLLIGSQIIFWAVIGQTERAARPPSMSMQPDVHFVLYDKAGEQISDSWDLKADRDRHRGYLALGNSKADYAIFSLLFTVADKTKSHAFFLENREYIDEISLNGVPIQPDKPLRRLQGDVSSETALYPLPSRYLQNGTNVLYIKTSEVSQSIYLAPFAIGPADELEQAYRIRGALEVDIPIAGVAILLFTIALCLVVNWPHEDRARMRWLIAFLAINAASTLLLTLAPQLGDPLKVQLPILVASNLLLGLSAGRYAVLDTGSNNRWPFMVACGFSVLIAAGVILLLIFRPAFPMAPYRFAILGSHAAAMALTLVAIAVLLKRIAVTGGERWLERMVLILCLTTFAVDRLAQFVDLYAPFASDWPISLYWSPIVGPLLGIGMVLSLARQAGEARREVARANEILADRLTEQDAALSRSYDAQKQMLGRQVMLEERQRIVRDMHDGIGGQLLGLMMQVRSGGVDRVEVEQGLQSSIADLRLIVDSMDSAEEGLAETLRSFEHRIRAQVEAAGMSFAVDHGLKDSEPGPGPRPTLQILRILQEAVTNAMRHSGGSLIELHSGYAEDGSIRIALSDDGKGMPTDIKGGRGLSNMQTRAQAVGGRIEFERAAAGTHIRLVIPSTKMH